MIQRPRRNRKSNAIRNMIAETSVSTSQLIYPLFVTGNEDDIITIDALPNIFRWGSSRVLKEVEECIKLGIENFVIFPVIPEKDKDITASYSYSEDNFYLQIIRAIKERFPQTTIMSDVAMDPYSSDGHDGLVADGKVLNDETLPILAKMSIAQAQAGVDIIGPSDMMDGRIGFIREALDDNGYTDTSIMAYTAKYASAYYGPFRQALDSAPKNGDKKTYQMDPANKQEALIEAALDESEGADFLMVKPALAYLDIIHILNERFELPITAYNVSGEYAMIHAAAQKGWLDYDAVMQETLLSIKRAGASAILTYFAKDFAKLNQ